MMGAMTERVVDKAIKYRAVFAEVSASKGNQQDLDTS